MADVISFPNRESMDEYLRMASKRAKQGLHPVQDQITYGDTWMQVVDVSDRLVVFGRVHTLDEVAEAEMRHGATYEEAREVVHVTKAQHDDGLLYGTAYSVLEPFGELGHTHKASVWPVDDSVFEAMGAADWRIDAVEFGIQVNLQIAWMAHRAWLVEKRDKGIADG